MSGPRVTSGEGSKQDYETPDEFMTAVVKRFGPISFDLAAHSGNKKHPRYFGPTEFVERGTASELNITISHPDWIETASKGNSTSTSVLGSPSVITIYFIKKNKDGEKVFERRTPNIDPEAYGLDAFKYDWAALSKKFGDEHPSGLGLLWDNCEWNDVDPWAEKHEEEMRKGANSLLLTPAVITNWYRDHIAGKADYYQLLGRLSFDGVNVYPKDCALSHFHPNATGSMVLWDWQRDEICVRWNKLAAR